MPNEDRTNNITGYQEGHGYPAIRLIPVQGYQGNRQQYAFGGLDYKKCFQLSPERCHAESIGQEQGGVNQKGTIPPRDTKEAGIVIGGGENPPPITLSGVLPPPGGDEMTSRRAE